MKALLVLLALTAVAAADMPPERFASPFDEHCREGATWADVEACRVKNSPSSTVRQLAADVKIVDERGMQYVYVHLDDAWHKVYGPADHTYEAIGTHAFRIGERRLRQVDFAHHISFGGTSVLMQRSSVVCLNGLPYCTTLTTACTLIERGRAVETLRGQVRVVDGNVVLEADQRYAGDSCRSR